MARPKRSCEHLGVCQARGFPCEGCTWSTRQEPVEEKPSRIERLLLTLVWALVWILCSLLSVQACVVLIERLDAAGWTL